MFRLLFLLSRLSDTGLDYCFSPAAPPPKLVLGRLILRCLDHTKLDTHTHTHTHTDGRTDGRRDGRTQTVGHP